MYPFTLFRDLSLNLEILNLLLFWLCIINMRPTGLKDHLRSPDLSIRVYTDFLSEGLINKIRQWHRKAASQTLNTIEINVLYINRVENNAHSL